MKTFFQFSISKSQWIALGMLLTMLCSIFLSSAASAQEVIHNGINWSNRTVIATGKGVWPSKRANLEDEDWYRLQAEEAAFADAQAKLLASIKGVVLEKNVTVEEAITKNSRIETYLSGVVSGATQLGETQFQGKIAKVQLQMPLDANIAEINFDLSRMQDNNEEALRQADLIAQLQAENRKLHAESVNTEELEKLRQENQSLRETLTKIKAWAEKMLNRSIHSVKSLLEEKEQKETEPAIAVPAALMSQPLPEKPKNSIENKNIAQSSPSVTPKNVPTGVILDVRDFENVEPVQFLRMVDANGFEVYGTRFLEREFAVQFGGAGYVKGLTAALSHDRLLIDGNRNPLTIRPIASVDNLGRDWILSNEDAHALRSWAKTATFLREARIVVVMK